MRHAPIDLARRFVEEKLVPWMQFEAAIVTGSVGHGEARDDSDVDMILVFDPLDVRIVPGEFVWSPIDDEYFPVVGPAAVEASEIAGIQIDAKRVSIDHLDSDSLADGFAHELAHGVVLFDRTGRVGAVIERRLDYPTDRRRARSFRHREWAGIHQAKAGATRRDRWVERVGFAGAFDVLVGGLEQVILLVHACNGVYPPYRYRWLLSIEHLDWVPEDFPRFRDAVLHPPEGEPEASLARACDAFDLVLSQVDDHFRHLGWAQHSGEVWADSHRELGFGYNLKEWKVAHQALVAGRPQGTQGTP